MYLTVSWYRELTLCYFQDELQTTTKSYEGQLSMMSEHLAGMNEKLTQQKDEIDDLRSQLSVAKVPASKVHAVYTY
jgi:protein phosphatase 1 regulatory subunit 21